MVIFKYGKNIHNLLVSIGHYGNGNLAIRLMMNDYESYTVLTVNFEEFKPLDRFSAFINMEYLEGFDLEGFLNENNLGELTGRAVETPYCIFPEVRFNEETLKSLDEKNFEEYDAYSEALEFLNS